MQLVESSIWEMSTLVENLLKNATCRKFNLENVLVENFQIFYKCAHLSSTDSDRNCRKLSLVDFGGTSLVENIWYRVLPKKTLVAKSIWLFCHLSDSSHLWICFLMCLLAPFALLCEF